MSRHASPWARGLDRAAASNPVVAGFRPAAAALAVAAAFSLHVEPLRAQPVGPSVIAGQASFSRSGGNLFITTQNAPGTNHSAINWQSFSVPGGTITRFDQPSSTSTSINRVLGPDPSAIYGTLSSNGKLVLVNPAGIAVGQGAVVDTAGFTASTLGMTEADAIAGRLRFSGGSGVLQVDGHIIAHQGDVTLIAPQVQTGASALVESNGATVLAAGQTVEITGRGLEGIRMEVQAPVNQAVNLGTLKGDAVGIFAGTLKHSGVINATAVSTEGGKVVLRAQGDALVSGSITAQAADGKGGSIDVLGQRVGLLAGAAVDASGANGGGQVLIGGDYQGKNPDVPNAQSTYVDAAATINADATDNGNGGRVIVWSDEATRMRGQISARGGPNGGDGGFSEVSGKQYLEFTGNVDLRAPQGKAGTLLLDPEDIEICNSLDTSCSEPSNPTPPTTNDDNSVTFGGGSGTSTISDLQLGTQLETSNVLVTTSQGTGGSGQITLNAGANVQWASTNALGLNADTGIVLNGSITAPVLGASVSMVANNGSITQAASGSVLQIPSLYAQSTNGAVNLVGANKIGTVAGQATGTGAAFTLNNAQALTIGTVTNPYIPNTDSGTAIGIVVDDGNNTGALAITTTSGALSVDTNAGTMISAGSISLTASDSTTGDLTIGATTLQATGGGMTLAAGHNLRIASDAGDTDFSYFTSTGPMTLSAANGSVSIGQMTGTPPYYTTQLSSLNDKLSITASGDIDLSVPATQSNPAYVYLSGAGHAGKGVAISSTGGNIDFGGFTSVNAYQSPIDVNANGSILGGGVFSTHGTTDGWIHLTATSGSIAYGSINSSGSYSGIAGGEIKLEAATGISGGDITASGSDSYEGETGGAGGNVTVHSSSGDINIGNIASNGGNNEATGDGGAGGAVSVVADAGNISIAGVSATGGSSSLGAGGTGGGITLTASATGSGSTITATGDLNVNGGESFDGNGGSGGAITVTSDGNAHLQGTAYASGGQSDDGGPGTSGGAGGTISITSNNGNIELGLQTSEGTSGGGAYLWGGDGFNTANGGAGGNLTLSALRGGIVAHDALIVDGGWSEDGTGGQAGTITGTALNDIQLQGISLLGGSAGVYGGGGTLNLTSNAGSIGAGTIQADGSTGGTISLNSAGGSITISSATATGTGNSTLGSGPGGLGGNVTLQATGAGGNVTVYGALDVSGGDATDSTPAGSNAGSIMVSAANQVSLDSARANGGAGSTGAGGQGGSIHISGATVAATDSLSAVGGSSDSGTAGAGGAIVVSASGAIQLTALQADAGEGSMSADGGNITVTSTGGDITLADAVTATGHGGGTVTVASQGGNITLAGIDASGREESDDSAPGNGGTIHIEAPAGTISSSGDFLAVGGFTETETAVVPGNGGNVFVHGQGDIQLQEVVAPAFPIGLTGGMGGSIDIESATGNVFATSLQASGLSGGRINVLADQGNISLGSAEAIAGVVGTSLGAGSGGAAAGGTIVLRAPGTGSGLGSVTVSGDLDVSGGIAFDGPGGNGGTITVAAGNLIHLGSLTADGGFTSMGSAAGGSGGTINLSTSAAGSSIAIDTSATANGADGAPGGTGGTIIVQTPGNLNASSLQAFGGNGSSPSGGAAGGSGGTINVAFGGNLLADSTTLDVSAGSGQDGGSGMTNGGAGGAGGTASLTQTTSDLALSNVSVLASGGLGGSAVTDGVSVGGAGGAGGTLTVAASHGTISMAGSSLSASGGFGGLNGDDATPAANGALGTANVIASGDLHMSGTDLEMGLSNLKAQAGGNIDLSSDITTYGGKVTLSAGDASVSASPNTAATLSVAANIDTTGDGLVGPADVMLMASGSIVVGVPDPTVTGQKVNLQAPTVTVASGNSIVGSSGVGIQADTLQLAGTVDSGTAGTSLTTFTAGRAIQLGGTDQGTALTLTQDTLNNISASSLVIGSTANTAGVQVLSAISVNPSLSLITGGTLGLGASVGSNAGGDAVVLAANQLNVSPGANVQAPNGRWLAYVAGPLASSNFGTLVSGNAALWNRTLAGSPPGTVSETGNRYLFAFQPTVTVTGDSLTKVYDGTTSFGSAGFTSTGLVDASAFGNVFLQDQLTGGVAIAGLTKNVGSYQISQGTLAAPAGYAMNFTAGTASITPRQLNVSAQANNKVYDATTAATASESDDRIAGDALTVGVSGSFTDKNVGAGKTVNLGVAVSGADAGNYTVSAPTTSHADITPAPLTIQANNEGKAQGTEFVFGGTEFSATGLVGGESVASVTLTSPGAPSSAPVGAYPITPSNAVGGNGFVAGNYDITYLNGALAVVSPGQTQQVQNQVVTFANLFTQLLQPPPATDKKDQGKDNIVITDQACK